MNIAAIVKNLGPSQCNFFLTKEFNKISEKQSNSCTVFVNDPTIPVVDPSFSCPVVAFLPHFKGVCISTDIYTTEQMLQTCGIIDKFFYIWDLEWTSNIMNYNHAVNIMRDENLQLIARSESHAKIISNFCNKEVCGIVDNWESSELLQITGNINVNK
jgi:hypothetical protein